MTILLATVMLARPDFVVVPTGSYTIGRSDRADNPVRQVKTASFEIASKETTNAEFRRFVAETRYVTDAERMHNGMVFETPLPEFQWIKDKTAQWRYPNGKSRGGINGLDDHPVTGISYADAAAYCRWAGVRLPTLTEWEVACRAGTKTDYFFGDDVSEIRAYANVWHGRDHRKPDRSDGYLTTSPVATFLPNPWGLYDMYGNVFEFCSGRMPRDKSTKIVHARGGSWWCSKNSCCFFNSFDIGKVDRHASFSNLGFRVVRDVSSE